MIAYTICYATFFILLFNISNSYNNNTLLLIMSFDGFRYNYIDQHMKLTNTLARFRSNSSYAAYMISVFPTKTFPNHFSIATGLYSEVHGVLDNVVYDKETNKILKYGYELFHYNEDIVPIWTQNEMAGGGRRSGCMMWSASNFPFQGVSPSHCETYNKNITFIDRVKILLSWFNHPNKPINLGMAYFEEPDKSSHNEGPHSINVKRKIAQVDETVEYLLKEAANTGLLNRLNIIILSDHGMNAVKVPENLIHLNHYIDDSRYVGLGSSPTLQIYPFGGTENNVAQTLKSAREKKGGKFTAYTREDMLDRWHYNGSERTPPIVLIADHGYSFFSPEDNYTNRAEIGVHGSDPLIPDMGAIFMAAGPMFKKNYKIQPFENINIYPLVAHMLNLPKTKVQPNGTLGVLEHILVSE